MLCEYSHTKCESLSEIHTTMGEIQHFSTGLFFIGTPCRCFMSYFWLSSVCRVCRYITGSTANDV